jgi:hypothetical protein
MGSKQGTVFIWSLANAEHRDKTPQQVYLLPHKANNTRTLSQAIALSVTLLFSYHSDKCCALFMFVEILAAVSLIFRSVTLLCKVQPASAASHRKAAWIRSVFLSSQIISVMKQSALQYTPSAWCGRHSSFLPLHLQQTGWMNLCTSEWLKS